MFRVFVFEPKSKALNSDRERIREAKIAMRPIILLTLLAVPVLMLLPVGHATTTTCTGTTGNAFVPTGPPTNVVTRQVNGFIIITENFGLCFTGAFNGDTQGTVTIIVNTSTGNGIFFGQNTFTGIVTTSSGSASGTIFVPTSSLPHRAKHFPGSARQSPSPFSETSPNQPSDPSDRVKHDSSPTGAE